MILIINDTQRGSNQQACPTPLLSPGSSRWREGWETGWNRGWRSDTKRMDLGSASPLLLSAPSASQEAYYPNKLNQGDWRWQKACEKVMWFRAENSERDGGNKGESTDQPMGSTSPSLHPASRILRAYPSPGLSQRRLVEFFSGEPEWTHILTCEKTSCWFITLKKYQQLTNLSTCTEIQIWFFVSYS